MFTAKVTKKYTVLNKKCQRQRNQTKGEKADFLGFESIKNPKKSENL
jgi:hypothetical protein